jgi:hypothetical protein
MAIHLSFPSFPSQNVLLPDIIYVAPATLLPSHLRARASAAHMCFFQIVDHTANAERLFVRVSALPHRLDDLDSLRVYTLCLSAQQLVQSLPWDHALQAMATCDVRELVELHARERCCGPLLVPEAAPTAAAPLSTRPQEEQDVAIMALPEIFVSCETVEEIVASVQVAHKDAHPHKQQHWMQLTWLRAAMTMLRRQRSHVAHLQKKLLASLATLDHAIRCAFVAQHRVRHPLVCASPVFIEGRQVGWHLNVGVPVTVPLAA